MTFLKQHFYIDAGVDLPMEEAAASKTVDSSSIRDKRPAEPNTSTVSDQPSTITDTFNTLSLDTSDYSVDNCTVNMTDDVKVNMRRKKLDRNKRYSHSEIPTAVSSSPTTARHKRHSSVYTDSCLATGSLINKRRSLNIHQKELSRIPVILRSVENMKSTTERDSIDEDVKERKEGKRLSSNLPVPIRYLLLLSFAY